MTMGTLCIFLISNWFGQTRQNLGGGYTGASLRCDMEGGGGASDLLFHVCIITLHGGSSDTLG